MTEPTPPRWRRSVAPFVPGLARTALLAVLCNLALELAQLIEVDGYVWTNKTPAFLLMFLLGSLVVWMLVGLVHAVVGRMWLTTAVLVTATAVVAVADTEKVRLLREPLYPSDWVFVRDLGFLTAIVGMRVVVLLVLGVLALLAAAFLGARAVGRRLARRHPQPHQPPPLRARILVRVLTGTVCLLGISYLAGFNAPGNAARATYDALGASWRPWSQKKNYLGNGFVGGFLYNLNVPTMPTPAGYSPAAMARISDRYAAVAARINRTRAPDGLDGVNVVMVLSESFSDPEALAGVHLDEDPIPYTRELMGTTMSGRMLAKSIGGGTANMEFEALTGMSMAQFPPQLRVPYQMLVPDYDSFPSAVRWFEGHGHRTLAIHPFTTEMYRRREVYRTFGFDDFVYDEKMHDQSTNGHDGYISDESAFGEVEQRIADSSEPLFVNLVTMQNHIPYGDRYDDPVEATGPNGDPMVSTGQYLRGLSYSDDALRGFIADLSASDEKTVLVFYGDHLPATYPDTVFPRNGKRTMHETPFFVWANFPGPDTKQPTTSPTHFMDLLLERADAPVSPYFALLQELREEVPGIDSGMFIDGNDRLVARADLSARARRLLHDYRLVQYDLSVGERYSEGPMFGPTG